MESEACHVGALSMESEHALHQQVLEIAGMCLICGERGEGCLMACSNFKTDLMLLP